MGYLTTKFKISNLVNINFLNKFINIKLVLIIIIIIFILQFNNNNSNTNLINDIPENLLPYLNKENYNTNMGSIELMRNVKSDFNTHFPMYNSSVVTTLTV